MDQKINQLKRMLECDWNIPRMMIDIQWLIPEFARVNNLGN